MLKEKAIKLRFLGKTYSEIRSILGANVPKSTLSYWCRNICLPDSYKEKIERINKASLLAGSRQARLNREVKTSQFLSRAKKEVLNYLELGVKKDFLKFLLAILYLGEGAKWSGHRGLMLGSSDPRIMVLYVKLLEKCYGIKKENIKFRVSYRADQDINILEDYWGRILGVERGSFYKTKPDLRTAGKKTKNADYKGVCVANCAGSDIQLDLDQTVNILLDKLRENSLK